MKSFKILLIVILLVVFSAGGSLAQLASNPTFGVKAGFNVSNVAGDFDNVARFSFHGGVYSEIYFDYFVMLQVEALISSIGHAGASTLRLNYLQIPFLARYNLDYNFNVHAGLTPGFMLSARNITAGIKTDVNDFFKAFDLGLPIGVGWQFSGGQYIFNVRYTFGLTNISSDAFTRRNNYFSFAFGYKLFQKPG